LHGCHAERLNDLEAIEEIIAEAAAKAHSTLIDVRGHRFSPHGVTAVGLLAESHLSVHTWPETGYAAVDIFTCGERCDPLLACDTLIEAFGAQEHSLTVLTRGIPGRSPVMRREDRKEAALCRARS
jgi:S-adenosylmethionine decarboxylase